MTKRLPVLLAAAVAVAGIAGFLRDPTWARRLADALPGQHATTASTPPPNVHKCRQPDGQVVYSDRPCERGAREQAVVNGTMTTVPALAPRPAPSAAGAGLIQGFDQATLDRLREQQIDAAANR